MKTLPDQRIPYTHGGIGTCGGRNSCIEGAVHDSFDPIIESWEPTDEAKAESQQINATMGNVLTPYELYKHQQAAYP